MKWTRKTAEEAVTFYSGLIERGAPLTAQEQRDLRSAAQFLRQVRKRPAFQNPKTVRVSNVRNIIVGWLDSDDKVQVDRYEVPSVWNRKQVTEHIRSLGHRIFKWKYEGEKGESKLFQNPQTIKAKHADVFIHNPPTKIYGKVLQIKAEKQSGPYKGQRFFHDFKNATAYGLPNGDVLITSRKKV